MTSWQITWVTTKKRRFQKLVQKLERLLKKNKPKLTEKQIYLIWAAAERAGGATDVAVGAVENKLVIHK